MIVPILFCLWGAALHTTAVKQQSKKHFQKIALQTGQTARFCHGYQEGFFSFAVL